MLRYDSRVHMDKKKKSNDNGTVDIAGIFGSDKSDSEKIQTFGIVLEDIHSQMKIVVEAVKSTEDNLNIRMDKFEQKVEQRFDTLEVAVRINSSDIKKLDNKIDGVEKRLAERIDKVENNLSKVENNLSKVENNLSNVERNLSEKIDRIGDRIENHEGRIVNLEVAVLPPVNNLE